MGRAHLKHCEVCGCDDKGVIDKHHIIPRTDPRTSHGMGNLAVLCANCHRRVHAGEIIIEGVYMTSDGHKLFWHYAEDPYIVRPGVFLQVDGTALILDE